MFALCDKGSATGATGPRHLGRLFFCRFDGGFYEACVCHGGILVARAVFGSVARLTVNMAEQSGRFLAVRIIFARIVHVWGVKDDGERYHCEPLFFWVWAQALVTVWKKWGGRVAILA